MPPESVSSGDAQGLEALWSGDFGDAYTDRNFDVAGPRGPFWKGIVDRTGPESILELGCNVGANLHWIGEHTPACGRYGLDLNFGALTELHRRSPEVRGVRASATALPFATAAFDLVAAVAVLIHQDPTVLPVALDEMVRCSRRWILIAELFAATETPVEWRGQSHALIKRDYGSLIATRHSDLDLVDTGLLTPDEGWDNVTYWLFQNVGR